VSRADRIPPEHEQLEFARNTKTQRVHILCSKETRAWTPVTRMNKDASAMLSLISDPCRMLCGVKLIVGSGGNEFPALWQDGGFDDGDLCMSCVQVLGDESWRAFHADNRGEDVP
jgi:hypothetical protein